MEALSMLPPNERSVRSKLQLFLRLWVARQKYEQLRPFGQTSAERIRFHLKRLRQCWDQVLSCQRATGLEVDHFAPRDQFEMIYVITAFIDRELEEPENTIIDIQEPWQVYHTCFERLSHQINPYEFGASCQRCQQALSGLFGTIEPEPRPIPLQSAGLKARGTPPLRMKDPPESYSSGLSRYSPGGRFS